jgi:NADPH:quinone reductase-like Zn-dependent oxidoreductase
MKAYSLVEPGKGIEAWQLVDLPEPTPGPGEVLIKVRATSLNYRDLMVSKGSYGKSLKPNCIPLSDGAGEITALGVGVSRWKIGDRVAGNFFQSWKAGPIQAQDHKTALGGATDGMLAQQVVLNESAIVRVPSHLSYEEAATLPCAGVTAWNALMETGPRLQPGLTVLIMGTGGVSIFALQFARAAGLQVIATSSSEQKLQRLRSMGVEKTINYKTRPEWQEAVRELTDGLGAHHIVEVGGGGTLARSLQAVGHAGTVSLIGVLTGVKTEVNPLPILNKTIRLQGIYVGSVQMFENMNRTIERLRIRPVIDEVFPFDQARQALAKLESGSHFGKIVIQVE